jgi:hypothetical protein
MEYMEYETVSAERQTVRLADADHWHFLFIDRSLFADESMNRMMTGTLRWPAGDDVRECAGLISTSPVCCACSFTDFSTQSLIH